MRTKTSFLTRCFAMFLALVMLATSSNMGIVLQAFAAEKQTVSVASLMADYDDYGLSDAEKALLGYLKSEVTVDFPQIGDAKDAITINPGEVTAKASNGWVVDEDVAAEVQVNGETVEIFYLENGKGTFDYDGDSYAIKVPYKLDLPVDQDEQDRLIAAIATLKAGYDTVATVAGENGTLMDMQNAMGELANLVGTEASTEALDAAYQQMVARMTGSELNLVKMIVDANKDGYIAYLDNSENGSKMKAEIEATVAAINGLVAALNTYKADLPGKIEEAKQALADAKQEVTDKIAEAKEEAYDKFDNDDLPSKKTEFYEKFPEAEKTFNDYEAAKTVVEELSADPEVTSNPVKAAALAEAQQFIADNQAAYEEAKPLIEKGVDAAWAELEAEARAELEEELDKAEKEAWDTFHGTEEYKTATDAIKKLEDLQDTLELLPESVDLSELEGAAANGTWSIEGLLADGANLADVNTQVGNLIGLFEDTVATFTYYAELVAGANMDEITVTGTLVYYKDGKEVTFEAAEQTVMFPVGGKPEDQASYDVAVKAVVDELKGEAEKQELDLSKFDCTDPAKDNGYAASYVPKTFEVEYYDLDTEATATENRKYGEQIVLPSHTNSAKIYEYEVTVNGNTSAYEQGEVITVEGNTYIEFKAGDPYVKDSLLAMIAKEYPAAAAVLNSGALNTDKVVKYRDPHLAPTLTSGFLTMPTAESFYGTNVWTAVSYKPDNGTLVDLKTTEDWAWNEDQYVSGISDEANIVDVNYELLIANAETVKKNLTLVNTLIDDATSKVDGLNTYLIPNLNKMKFITWDVIDGLAQEAKGTNLTEAQQNAFAAMAENAFEGKFEGAQLTLYKLVVAFDEANKAGNGVLNFYENAHAFIKEVNGLNGDLNAMLGENETEKANLRTFLVAQLGEDMGPETFDALDSMKGQVASASAKLALNGNIKANADLGALGAALNGATKISTEATDLTVSAKTAVEGEGKVKLTITLKPQEGLSESTFVVYEKNDAGEKVLSSTEITALIAQVKEEHPDFFDANGIYAKFYENNFAELKNDLTDKVLTKNEELTYNWDYKTVDVTVPGMAVQTGISLGNDVITLAGTGDANARYEYVIDGRIVKVGEDNLIVSLSEDELLWLLNGGQITRNDFGKVKLTIVLKAEDEEIKIENEYEKENGEAAALDIADLKKQVETALKDLDVEYYESDYDELAQLGDTLSETKEITYNWTLREFTVVIPGAEEPITEAITIKDAKITLPASTITGIYYNYVIGDKTVETKKTDVEYDFGDDFAELFGEEYKYEIVRTEVTYDPTQYNVTVNVMDKAAEVYLKDNAVAQEILNHDAVELDDSATVGYFWPTEEDLVLQDGILYITNVVANANQGLYWIPVNYQFKGQDVVELTGEAQIPMDDSIEGVTVNYKLTYASAETVKGALGIADALVADAQAKVGALNALLSNAGAMSKLTKMVISTVRDGVGDYGDGGDFSDDEEENKMIRAYFWNILNGMRSNCYGSGTNAPLKLHTLLNSGYTTNNIQYYYDNYEAFVNEVGILTDSMNALLLDETVYNGYQLTGLNKALEGFLDWFVEELSQDDDIGPMIEGMDLYPEMVNMQVRVNEANNNMKLHSYLVDNADQETLSSFGAVMQRALNEGYTPVAANAGALTDTYPLIKQGKGSVSLTINLSSEDGKGATAFAGTYSLKDGQYTLNADEIAAVNAAVAAKMSELGLNDAKYSKFFEGGFDELKSLTLTANKVETVTWSYKKFTVNVPGKDGQIVTLGNRTITLPAAPAGQTYIYKLADQEIKPDANNQYTLTEGKFMELFANTDVINVVRIANDYATLKLTLNVAGETDTVERSYEKDASATSYKLTAEQLTELEDAVNASLEKLGYTSSLSNYYDASESMNLGALVIENGLLEKTYTWTIKNYTVNVPGMAAQTINKDNMFITLAKSPNEKVSYQYTIGNLVISDQEETEFFPNYEFHYPDLKDLFVNGVLDVQRKVINLDTGDYDEKNVKLLSKIADLIDNSAAKEILGANAAFKAEFSEVFGYKYPIKDKLTISGDQLNVPEQESNWNDLLWTPGAYEFSTGESGNMNGVAGDITKPNGAISATVTYMLPIADAEKVKAKLQVIDDLVADAAVKAKYLDDLAEQETKLSLLNTNTVGALISSIRENNSDVENGFFADEQNGLLVKMMQDCFDGGKLRLYNYISAYTGADGGLKYFYANADAFQKEVERLSGYLTQMLATEARREVLQDILAEMGYGTYIDQLDSVEVLVAEAKAALVLPEVINPGSGKTALGALGTALNKAVKNGYTNVAGTAKNLVIEYPVTWRVEGAVTVTINVKIPGNSKVVDKTFDKSYTLTREDITKLEEAVAAAEKVLGITVNGEVTDHYKFFFKNNGSWVAKLPATLNDDVSIDYEWTYKDFLVNVDGYEGEQTVNLGNLEIKLPVSTDSTKVYYYTIGNMTIKAVEDEVVDGFMPYALTAEAMEELFAEAGNYTVVRTVEDASTQGVRDMVAALNNSIGKEAFALETDSNGKPTAIVGNIGAGDIMGMATGLVAAGYPYIGMNGKDLLVSDTTGTTIYMQALVDAMLSNVNFGSETIIAMGSNQPAELLNAEMVLGNSADDSAAATLDFIVNLTGAPAEMAEYAATAASALSKLKNVFWFHGSGDPDKPEMKVFFNLDENVSVSGIQLEKIYEVYLTALLGTGNVTKDDMNEINNKIAFEFLLNYLNTIIDDDNITTQTFENTLAKLGMNANLSEYEKYYQMGRDFWGNNTEITPETNELDVNVQFGIEKLLNKIGISGTLKSQIYESRTGTPLKVEADASLENVKTDYQALVLDVAQVNASGLAKANAFDYTTNLPGRMAQVTGQSAVILLSDVTGDIKFPGTAILDLNGHTVNGNVTAGGKLFIVDSHFETNTPGAVTGTVSGSGVAVVGGHYAQDVSAYLPEGYIQENGYVRSALFSVEVQNNNITYVLDSNVVEAGISEYVPFAQTLAVDIAVDLALNYFTAAALSIEGNGIYAVDFGGLLAILDKSDKIDEVLRQAVEFFNEDGISDVADMILDDLLDFKGIKAALKGDGIVATYDDVVTNAWQVDVIRNEAGDYLDLKIVSGKEVLRNNIKIKIGGDHLGQVKTLIAELADITDAADIDVNLTNLEYIGSSNSLQVVGDASAIYHADLTKSPYATVIAVVLANGGSAQKDKLVAAVNASDKAALKDAFDKVTVQEIFNALKALNRADDFATIAKNAGVDVDKLAQEIADAAELENIYHLFLVVGGKGLETLKIDGMSKAMGGLDQDDDGVYEFTTTVTREGRQPVSSYFVDYNAGPISVDLSVKLFADETYILPKNLEIEGAPVGKDSEILDSMYATYGDHILATSYEYENADSDDVHKIYPTEMYVWELFWRADAGEYEAVEVKDLHNILIYYGTSIRINFSSDGIRFITELDKIKRNAMISGEMLADSETLGGYKMVEAGTLFRYADEIEYLNKTTVNTVDPVSGKTGGISYVYGGKVGTIFREFVEPGNRDASVNRYTGVIAPIPSDAKSLSRDIVARPFITMENENGDQYTIYGGSYERSVFYVATQNHATYAAGSQFYNYIWNNIILKVDPDWAPTQG